MEVRKSYLNLDDIMSDRSTTISLRRTPVEIAVVGPPVQDIGSPRLGWLVCNIQNYFSFARELPSRGKARGD